MKHYRNSLAGTLRGALRTRNWTQSELARRADQTQPFISQLINGHRKAISLDRAVSIANALGIAVDELAGVGKAKRKTERTDLLPAQAWLINPPPGSKASLAQRFGVDLSLNISLLRMSDDDRIKSLVQAVRLLERLYAAKNTVT